MEAIKQLTKPVAVLLAASLLACSSWEPDQDLFGLHLDNRSALEWANRPDFKARLRTVVAASLTHVGMRRDELQGIRLVVKDDGVNCGLSDDAAGCWDQTNHTITVSTRNRPCVELLALPHEFRHVASGDSFHAGGGWAATDEIPLEFAVGRADCLAATDAPPRS